MLMLRWWKVALLTAVFTVQVGCTDDEASPESDPSVASDPSSTSDPTDPSSESDSSDPSATTDDPSTSEDPSTPSDTDDPTDPTDPTAPSDLDVVECTDAPEYQPSETCSVLNGSGSSTAILGTILAQTTIYERGAVVFDSEGTITCVGCGCTEAGQAQIDCGDHVVTPGLINAHDHIGWIHQPPAQWGEERFEHRHDWRKGKRGHSRISSGSSGGASQKAWGELRQLMTGTTSIMASGNAAGMLRNLDSVTYQEGLGQGAVDAPTFPLGDSNGVYVTDDCGYPSLPNSSVLDEDAWIPHVGEGIDDEARNEFLCIAYQERGGVDVTESNGAFIHAIGLKAPDAVELAVGGTSVVWSPRSNISLYGNTAQVTLLDTVGVRLAMGTDWTPSGSTSMLRELACASYLNETHYNNYFTDQDLWLMATLYGAEVAAVDDALGSLKVGLVADISIFKRGDGTPYQSVVDAATQDVIGVLRGGKWLYGESQVLGEWDPSCLDTRDICGRTMRFCLDGEINGTLAQLESENVDSYGLFFCDTPAGEPTCIPSRENEYDGSLSAEDTDGDGVSNAEDNCPDIFNPIRPVDGGVQGNYDSDGLGDVCDPCPMDADTDICSLPDPDDRDGDGILNAADNCPSKPNPDQIDTDGDGKGDACDDCRNDPNPGQELCPISITDIKSGTLGEGERGQIEGVVTARSSRGFWIQQNSMSSTQYLGIYVYAGSGVTLPAEGHLVSVGGSVGDYYGQIQLSDITEIRDLGPTQMPEPVEVIASTVATGGDASELHEGMLIRVRGIVDSLNPPAGDGTGDSDPTNAFVIDGLRIDDYLYERTSLPEIGTPLVVTGVLRFGNQHSKLEPRRAEDVVIDQSAEPVLLAPATRDVYAEVSDTLISTYPPLNLSLSSPAGTDGLSVSVSSSELSVEVDSLLTFESGSQTEEVLVRATNAGVDAVLTLVEGARTYEVNVTTLSPERTPSPVLDNATVSLALAQSFEVRVNLSEPAPVGGTIVESASAGGLVELSSGSETVPAWQSDAVFTIQVGSVAGEESVTFTTEGGSVVLTVNILSVVPTLFISEYSEGSSNNKYLEIYNPTGASVDLNDYRFSMCNNGCDVEGQFDYPNSTFDAGATIAAGDVYVLCHPSASSTIAAQCDETYNFLSNGNDAFALTTASGDIIDMVGTTEATDVGDGWSVAGVSGATKDHTLIRKPEIQRGEPQWSISAGSNEADSQWVVLNKDEWSYLGSHPHDLP